MMIQCCRLNLLTMIGSEGIPALIMSGTRLTAPVDKFLKKRRLKVSGWEGGRGRGGDVRHSFLPGLVLRYEHVPRDELQCIVTVREWFRMRGDFDG